MNPISGSYINNKEEYFLIFDKLKHSHTEFDGKCPYCNSISQCIHWDGIGWSKNKNYFGFQKKEMEASKF